MHDERYERNLRRVVRRAVERGRGASSFERGLRDELGRIRPGESGHDEPDLRDERGERVLDQLVRRVVERRPDPAAASFPVAAAPTLIANCR